MGSKKAKSEGYNVKLREAISISLDKLEPYSLAKYREILLEMNADPNIDIVHRELSELELSPEEKIKAIDFYSKRKR